jgi:hypothetical protein
MFDIEFEHQSANTIHDIPIGDYVVTNSHFYNFEEGSVLIIYTFEVVVSPGVHDVVLHNLLYECGEFIGVKEAVLIDGVWRNEAGQTASNIAEFLPDNFLEFELLNEEICETFTLDDRRKVKNRNKIF